MGWTVMHMYQWRECNVKGSWSTTLIILIIRQWNGTEYYRHEEYYSSNSTQTHTHTALIVILQANFGYSQLPCCSCLSGNLCMARCSSCCQHSMDLIVSLSITWLLKERNVIILLTMLTLKQVPSINTIRDVVLVSTSQSRDVVSKCLGLVEIWEGLGLDLGLKIKCLSLVP